jgi:hypothetical protein
VVSIPVVKDDLDVTRAQLPLGLKAAASEVRNENRDAFSDFSDDGCGADVGYFHCHRQPDYGTSVSKSYRV